MSGCSIYIIELSLLQPLLLVFQVYRELPPRQSVTGLANSEFGHEDLMLDQFWPASTGVHVLVGVIHWGSELWGASAEFGSATSHIFFCKDVMDGPPHTLASKWAFRPSSYTNLCEVLSLQNIHMNFQGIVLFFFMVVGYCCLHYDASTAKSFNFLYVDRGETLISTPVYAGVRPSHLYRKKCDSLLSQIRH
jgi:hypothetical protein